MFKLEIMSKRSNAIKNRKEKRVYKKYGKDYFKNLREKSEKKYASIPPLNWGEEIGGKHVYCDRYFFEWSVPDKNGILNPIIEGAEEHILNFREENKDRKMKIYIGVDSQNYITYTRYVAVIVMRLHKNGAHELVARINLDKIYDVRYKLLREADVMGQVVRQFKSFFVENNIEFECHMDYNRATNLRSNGVVKEAESYLKTQGVNFELKPEAWAASTAADYFC